MIAVVTDWLCIFAAAGTFLSQGSCPVFEV
jgi:hypothetical protein